MSSAPIYLGAMTAATTCSTAAATAATVAAQGYRLPGRASKTISDALRWEVRRGRVVRLGRGRYCYATAPASTARRIRIFARRCRAWIADVARGERPVPFPRDPRPGHYWRAHHDPGWPPWAELRWLWVLWVLGGGPQPPSRPYH
jgi:hypothetical protein